ncbi:NUDIX domain-containing protein [Halomicrococcus gelatinilyticus]|uniref:NUDIX domain-containing protein n=1 Tax=Halomicrococcus gelatinilyticus TaxID=1702103 RepID=UPI002E1290BB
MTTQQSDETTQTASVEPITDAETLRERDDVPVHDDEDVVDEGTLDVVDDLDDLAVVGVTNDDGAVLLRRLTEDCEWKLPVEEVARDEDYADAARRAVEEVVGLPVALHAVEAAWHFEARLADGDRTATRDFVVFSASPASDAPDLDDLPVDAAEDAPAAVGWFDELPADAEEAPGTRLFFD